MTTRPRAPSWLGVRYAVLAVAVFAALLIGGWALAADGLILRRYVVAGGGGRAVSKDGFALSASAGQPVASGPVSAGAFSVSAGFWVPATFAPTEAPTGTPTPTATGTPTATVTPTSVASATPTKPAQYLPQISSQ